MLRWLTPRRRRGIEVLDGSGVTEAVRQAAMRDLVKSNRLFGGTRAATSAFSALVPTLPRETTLLDVGTGQADIPRALRAVAARGGVTLACLGVDLSAALLRDARGLDAAAAADAMRLPFRDASVDVVVCSQLLHHFEGDDVRSLIAELDRVARRAVIVSDLRRSWFAVAGFWISAFALRWHAVTRHDGVTSVLRGFTADEVADVVRSVTSQRADIRQPIFWRVTATWHK